jgi:EmrB/QacA subfamily drug resistance transporter
MSTGPQLAEPALRAEPAGGGRRGVAIGLCCIGAFIAFLDGTIVNIAFPSITHSFPAVSLSELSWVLNGYNVVIAAFLVPAGRLADRLGVVRAFVLGLVVFSAASGLCAAATGVEMLIAARVVQGVGAAILVPTSLALLLPEFALADRLGAVAVWGVAAAVAAGIGPALGGVLVESNSWRMVFLVNVPIGLATAVGVPRVLRERKDPSQRAPDIVGTVVLAAGLGLLALGIVQGHDWRWNSAAVLASLLGGTLAISVVLLRSRRHPAPVVELHLLATRASAVGNIGTLLFATAFYAGLLNNVVYLTDGWKWSVLHAGLAVTPAPVLAAMVARPAGRIADRLGGRSVIVPGCLCYIAGTLLLAWGAGQRPDFVTHWLPGAILVGVGTGMTFPTLTGVGLSGYGSAALGTGSAVNAAGRQIGGILGTAVLVSLLSSRAGMPLAAARAGWYFVIALAACSGVAVLGLPRKRVAEIRLPQPSRALDG